MTRTWDCDVCGQRVEGVGPWCDLYTDFGRNVLCRPLAKKMLNDADTRGDGPMVNALCAYGRKKWGEDLDW